MSAVQEEIDSGRLKALEELFNELRNMFGSDFDKSLAKDGYIELESEDDDDEVFFTREKALDFFDTRYSNFINKSLIMNPMGKMVAKLIYVIFPQTLLLTVRRQ